MRNINYSSKKAICSICVIMALWPLGVNAATLPPDPDNAALLYYQAMLNQPELDNATNEALYAFLRSAEPDEKIRTYLKNCQKTFELFEAAARIPGCDWGIQYSEGTRANCSLKELDVLSRILCADALILAADGNYMTALVRSLASRQLAAHIGDDTMYHYSISCQADRLAIKPIRRVLCSMPPDVETLTWLQDQIAAVRGAPQSPAKALKINFEMVLQTLRTSPNILARMRVQLVEKAQDERAKKIMQNLTDEELVARAREPYAAFLDSALRVIDSAAPHEEKYMEIEKLTRTLKDEFGSDPAANEIIEACADQVLRLYRMQVSDTARFNALKVAISIYIEKARTGQMPTKLPAGLPKDPYSGRDFEYDRTGEGFVLRSQVKSFDKDRIRRFEFKVQR